MEKIAADLRSALAADERARTQWEDLTPIVRRDFASWIESAKQPETRKRRIKVACSKLAAGQRRPGSYALVPLNLYKALRQTQRQRLNGVTSPRLHAETISTG